MTPVNGDNRPIPEELVRDLDGRVGLLMLVCSGLILQTVNSLFIWLGRSVASLRLLADGRCRNLAVSWLHAVISAVGCGYSYLTYRKYLENLGDLIDYKPYPSYLLATFSCAYFIYDTVDNIKRRRIRECWEVLAHHVWVLASFSYGLWFQTCIGFLVVALLTEVNSVFLHARKLMQMFRVPFSHWLYRLVVVVNLVTFVVFRGLALFLPIVGLVHYGHRISRLFGWMVALTFLAILAVNLGLFWLLLRSDVLRGFIGKKGKFQENARGTRDGRELTVEKLSDQEGRASQGNGSTRKAKFS